jgi:superfamily II DNA/RNA helicase
VSSSSLKRFQILSVSKLILLSSSTRLLSTSSSASSSASTAFAFQVSPTTVKQFRPLQYQQYQQYQQFQPFHSSTFIPTKSTIMDEQQEHVMFSNLSARRITSLFSRSSSAMDVDETSTGNTNGSGKDFSTKNKKNELKRLAKTMDVEVSKVKELLKRQQSKLDPNSDKGQYVNWLLSNDRKKKTSSTALADKRKRSDSNTTTNGNSAPGIENKKPNEKKSKTIRPQKPSSKSSSSMNDDSANENNASSGKNSNLHSSTKFKDQNMHPNTKKAITNLMKHEYMTDIQSETYLAASKGTDVLGRARTGTGKTLAFLIPALERLLSSNAIYTPGKNVGVLVISPTRELATQIGDQAEKLLTYHKGLSCQVMFGGTKMGRDVNMLNKRLPTVLVATPGRLLDHLENTKISGRKFGYDIMTDTPLLVLDEADRLLDMGFKREIEKIMSYLPRQEKRQTLLFSATVPKELKKIMSDNMRPDYIEVDCIGGDGSTEFVDEQHTNVLVQQSHVVLPSLDRYVTSVVEIVKHSMQDRDHKLVVFFPTARLVGFFAELFNLGLGIEVIELHSRKTQGYRNTASEKFRKAKTGILFTSDVSARGE